MQRSSASRFMTENKHLFLVSLFTFLLIYTSTFIKAYGYFIDEFYYIACANNPAAGYVDQPPLAPLLLTLFQFFFGNSIYSIRILPALGQSGAVFSAGLVTKEIGGGKFAQIIAACAMAASPTIIAFGGFYSMNAFEPLLATLLIYLTIKMIKENNPKRWIVMGIIMGIGMMNKHTFGIFIIAFIFSLLVAGKWKLVINKWFIFGGLCGLLIFLPNIIWQVINNYPSLEFYRNISLDKNVYTPPLAFIMGQGMNMSPSTVPVWFTGFLFLLFSKSAKEFRFLSILFISLFLFMLLSGTSRADRLAFAYPAAFAGGALLFERIFVKFNFKWLKIVFIIFLFSGLALALPIILPYFSYGFVEAQTKFLGINTEIEKGNKPPLPQLLADRIGWHEKFDLVLSAYNSLSDQDKKSVIIAANNYGQAGAIELFGKDFNLPPVVCGHNNYYLWSRERLKGNILLQFGQQGNYNGLIRLFEKVETYPIEYKSPFVTSHENNLKVFICRGPKIPYLEMLEQGKNYH
jgi:hypothetical protein